MTAFWKEPVFAVGVQRVYSREYASLGTALRVHYTLKPHLPEA